jgi:hypothetical protein
VAHVRSAAVPTQAARDLLRAPTRTQPIHDRS